MGSELDKNSKGDYISMTLKSALGVIPFAGPFLSEIAGSIIPNQKIDRLVKFAEVLDGRLSELENKKLLEEVLQDEQFTDLVEEGMRQASRSLSDERRMYLANLIGNSIETEDIGYQESKHLMRILGELNDIEVIWLRFYQNPLIQGDIEFREANKEVLQPVAAYLGSGEDEIGKESLQKSYKEHLVSLGLLENDLKLNQNSDSLELKKTGYNITTLGRLVLKEIGLISSMFER